MHVNRLSLLLVAAVSVPLLAGCSGSGASGIALLEQPATEKDALPPGNDIRGYESGTERLAARVDGFSFYVALPASEEDSASMPARPGACIIVAEPAFTGCGGLPIESMGSFGS